MKPSLTLGIIVFALALAGVSLGERGKGQGAASGAPKLTMAQTEFHLGLTKVNESLTHTFTLRNEGTADLKIEDVAPC